MEVTIGGEGNSKSSIREALQDKPSFDTNTKNILHCNEFRTFWIQWLTNAIAVGRGPVIGEQKFMNIDTIQASKINSIGLASDKGHAAVWKVNENNGNGFSMYLKFVV